ncbi:MAG TPA: divergent PAP2 family protein [bacterium]|nr:divergent PAP2 family protein [bacterium]HNS34370.1 divergent PAP2 family protein [bacterium]HNZ73735.1 divergent PAP2 family protein [bacterium]HOH67329.1 divergent PAP2 family protein [bacterium]HQA63605.1 divergent PAP2 family protein [bacterium]
MYQLILIPIIVGALTQAIKLIIDGIPNNFTWQHLISDYGGMPSAHTAFVASLATVVGLTEGLNSAVFAVALVLLAIVIRDAVGFRREIGHNAVFTNVVAQVVFKNLPPMTKQKIEFLNEEMGHSVVEVAAGLIIGGALSVMLYFLFLLII